jgi:phosphatidylserine decarboxylase
MRGVFPSVISNFAMIFMTLLLIFSVGLFFIRIAVREKMIKRLMESLTVKQGKKFDDPSSVKYIKRFIKYHKISVDEILEPLDSFKSFNEFFYRRLKPGTRSLGSPDKRVAVSPADCRMLCFPTIEESTRLWIKGRKFSLEELLEDQSLVR